METSQSPVAAQMPSLSLARGKIKSPATSQPGGTQSPLASRMASWLSQMQRASAGASSAQMVHTTSMEQSGRFKLLDWMRSQAKHSMAIHAKSPSITGGISALRQGFLPVMLPRFQSRSASASQVSSNTSSTSSKKTKRMTRSLAI